MAFILLSLNEMQQKHFVLHSQASLLHQIDFCKFWAHFVKFLCAEFPLAPLVSLFFVYMKIAAHDMRACCKPCSVNFCNLFHNSQPGNTALKQILDIIRLYHRSQRYWFVLKLSWTSNCLPNVNKSTIKNQLIRHHIDRHVLASNKYYRLYVDLEFYHHNIVMFYYTTNFIHVFNLRHRTWFLIQINKANVSLISNNLNFYAQNLNEIQEIDVFVCIISITFYF